MKETDLVYVVCGRLEVFCEYGLSPWDEEHLS